jgi:putative tryptophan/tyrosine transport system substrate-binding protein
MGRKPTVGERTGSAALFHGGKQHRQIRGRVQRGDQGSGALAIISSPFINSHQKRIADNAAKNRLPAIYPRDDFVENGGLMSYGPDRVEPYKRVASIVDKILKGRKPAELPVEQPTKFELVLNLKTAKALGLTIPPVVMMRAEKVIK